MSTQPAGGVPSASVDGYTIQSTSESVSDIEKNLTEQDTGESEEERVSKAASELGKKGGEAAAKARKAIKPIPPKQEAKPAAKVEAESDDETEESKAANDDEEEEPKPGKPRHDPKARMLEATRKEAEAKAEARRERERAYALEQRLAALEARQNALAPRPDEQPQKPAARQAANENGLPPRPKPDDFDTWEEYEDARDEWSFNTRLAGIAEKAQEAQRVKEAHERVVTPLQRTREAIETAIRGDPSIKTRVSRDLLAIKPTFDIDPVSGQVGKLRGRVGPENDFMHKILSSENAVGLMLYVSENYDVPEFLQRIAALPDRESVVREVAKLEARLEAATTAPSSKPDVSRAHPPVRTVTGQPTTTDDGEPSDSDDYDTWKRKQDAKDAKERRRAAGR